PDSSRSVRHFVRRGCGAASISLHGDPAAAGARQRSGCADSRGDVVGPVRAGADVRVRRGAARWELRDRFDGAAAGGVLRDAAAGGTGARTAGQGSGARTRAHIRIAALRGLALRDGEQSCGGAAGCEDGGVLQVVPEAGVRKRVLVGWRDSGVRGPRQFMTISIRVCVLLATACAPGLFSAGFTMRVTEK